MAQTVCVLLDATGAARLAAIASDRSRPLKHTQRAHIVLLSAERLSVQDVARRAGLSRPAVWRWQRRYAEAGVEGLLRDKTCRSAHYETRSDGAPDRLRMSPSHRLPKGVVQTTLTLHRRQSPSDNVRPGLSGRDGGDSRRVLKPDLDVPCGPRPLAGSITVRACDTKPT